MTGSFTEFKNIRKTIKRLVLSASNVSRGLFLSVFGLLLNYILLNYKSSTILDTYVFCIAFVNLLLVFNNWGGREYTIQTLSLKSSESKTSLSSIINSRFILFILLLIPIFFTTHFFGFKKYIIVLLFFKTLNSVFESMIIIHKRFFFFMIIDLVLNVLFIGTILFDSNINSAELFLIELSALELIRLVIHLIAFKKSIAFKLNFKTGLHSLGQSKRFFLVAFAGFVCSRADLYAVDVFLDKHALSTYYILINLVILCQIFYTTFVSTFSSNIYRYNSSAFKKFEFYSAWRGTLISIAGTACIYFLSTYYYKIKLDVFFIILVFANILSFTFVLIKVYYFTRLNLQKVILKVIVFAGCVNILLSMALTVPFGLKGAFLSNTVCMITTYYLFKFHYLSNEKKIRN